MANTFAPKGFREYGQTDGVSPNFGLAAGKCLYTTALFSGDPLIKSAGYLSAASTTGNTGAGIVGIAYSFSWNSIAQGRTVRAQYYPGSDSVSNADVTVHFGNSPNSLFTAQVASSSAGTAAGGPLLQASVGLFINFATGAGGSTTTQQSSFCLDYSTLNASSTTLPFFVYNLEVAPATDPTSAGNMVIVGFNPSSFGRIG